MAKEKVAMIKYPAVPTQFAEVDSTYIEAYCEANGETDWLVEQVNKTYVGKDGKERDNGLFQIRKEFFAKFFPNVQHKTPAKKETFKDRINKKYKK